MDPREEYLLRALNSYNNNEYSSIRATARVHVVSGSTLRSRINGTTNRRVAHAHEQRLSSQQETFLIDWILKQETQGFPPSFAPTREMATRIIQLNGDFQPLGKKYITKFMKSHTRIRSVVGRPIEAARINGTHPDLIQEVYQSYEEIVRQYDKLQYNTWNMDGHGIALTLMASIGYEPPNSGIWRLLILDGHGRHTATDFLWFLSNIGFICRSYLLMLLMYYNL
ncbi:hypothetical protein E4T45_04517 [Aureobasidium sp. EXF-8846]|nr:hypothetical protein E4T45_04517 [Aureobasidium sp. EXF-8846]